MRSRFARCLDGILEAGWLTALIAVPVFFNTQTARSFEPDKLALLRILALVMAAIWLVRWIDGRGWRRWHRLGRKPLVLPVTMLVVSYFAATALSVDPATSWFGSYQRGQGAYTLLAYVTIFGVMATTLREPAQLERVFAVIMATTVPVALYVIVQRHGLDPLPWSTDVQRRAGGQLGNPIFAAGYLIMVVPLTLARVIPALTHPGRTDRWSPVETAYVGALLMVLALQLTAIALTLARGPWMSLALGLLLFLLLLLASSTTGPVVSRRPALRDAMLSSAIGLALVLVPLALVSRFLDSSANPVGSLLSFLGLSGVLLAAVVAIHGYRDGVQRVLVDLVVLVLLGAGLLFALNTVPEPDAGAQEDALTADLRRTLHDWRGIPTLNRMVRLTEWDRGTGRVRVLIWEGVLDLLTDREPLRQADGTPDRFAALRPLFGYGPESMQLVYHRHFPTDLATVERRGRFPDRAHNELYDTVITTGLLGLLAWHLLFFATFHYGLKRLGLLRRRRHGYAFLACWIGGAAASAAALVTVLGPPYVGVAVPLGMLAGLGCYLLGFALLARGGDGAETRAVAADRLLSAGLLAAIAAHFMEIHMGIATATTRLYFFTFLALLLSSGLAFGRRPFVPPPNHHTRTPRLEGTGATVRPVVRTLTEPLIPLLLLGLVLGASAIPFLNWNPIELGWSGRLDALPTATQMLRNVLAAGPGPESAAVPVLLVFVLAPAWVLGALLLAPTRSPGAVDRSAAPGGFNPPRTAAGLAFVALGGAALALLLAYWQASLLRAALSASWTVSGPAAGVPGTVRIAEAVAGHAPSAPLTLAGIGALLGAVLALRCWSGGRCLGSPAAMVATALLPAVVYLAATTNLDPVRADAIHKQAVAAGQLPADGASAGAPGETLRALEAAVAIGQRAVAAMPREEAYRLFHAYALAVLGERADAPPRRVELMQEAREQLAAAQAMHPFSPAPTANLARWHARWAEMVPGEARTQELAAAVLHYRQAIGLSPRDAPLRNEYARLLVRAGADCLQALEALRVSVQVDPHLAETYFLQAAHATACAEAAGATEQVRLRDEVIESLAAGLRLEPEDPRRLMLAAEIHLRWEGDASLAMARHEEARMLGTEDYPAWRMDVAMAQWFLDRGDPVEAARYGRLALESAPPAVEQRLTQFLRQLPDLPGAPSP